MKEKKTKRTKLIDKYKSKREKGRRVNIKKYLKQTTRSEMLWIT